MASREPLLRARPSIIQPSIAHLKSIQVRPREMSCMLKHSDDDPGSDLLLLGQLTNDPFAARRLATNAPTGLRGTSIFEAHSLASTSISDFHH